jgi:hypothetical protein
MGVMDTQAQMSGSQKEIDWLRRTLSHLSHQDDLKVTFTNGYHVNAAVTATQRVLIDESCYQPDYNNFFKATQPVVDEEGLSPPEFTLLKGVFQVSETGMRSYKKGQMYLGQIPGRDFAALDLNLTNLFYKFRKILQANLSANESQARQYALARLGHTEADLLKQSNAS